MSTNAYIGIVTNEGTIRYIYSHWDGYLSGVGNTLLENYNTTGQVEELLSNGDISSLDATIAESEFFHRDHGEPLSEVSAQETDNLYDLDQEFNYVWTGSEWLVDRGRTGWSKLAYLVEAEIEDPEGYMFGKEVA